MDGHTRTVLDFSHGSEEAGAFAPVFSEPLWSITRPRFGPGTSRTFGELAFAAPPDGATGLLLDAGAFGALPVEPRE
ncbi:hypothetical protein [Nocardiopsis sp. YSL2]|uniref:hypothetical protein n=1 Tax=Nocardiopsis sp. YSL2 TaxID=2939492 RepID=UPI0026F42C1E|nr:hypothetical protein [Nocardiopsis sp. YSL2]